MDLTVQVSTESSLGKITTAESNEEQKLGLCFLCLSGGPVPSVCSTLRNLETSLSTSVLSAMLNMAVATKVLSPFRKLEGPLGLRIFSSVGRPLL